MEIRLFSPLYLFSYALYQRGLIDTYFILWIEI